MLRKCIWNKSEPPCEEIELLEAIPTFTYVHFPDGKDSSVSIKDLSPCPSFDTSSHPRVENPADIVPERCDLDPGREQKVTATPVEKEPDDVSPGVDRESTGDNTMPPRWSTYMLQKSS